MTRPDAQAVGLAIILLSIVGCAYTRNFTNLDDKHPDEDVARLSAGANILITNLKAVEPASFPDFSLDDAAPTAWFRLAPGTYVIEYETDYWNCGACPYLFKASEVTLLAGHRYIINEATYRERDSEGRKGPMLTIFWIEDLTTSQVIDGSKDKQDGGRLF